jgi:uncharacterized protein (TIGR00369 family)
MRLANSLALLESYAPRIAPLVKKWFVEYGVPMNRAMGLCLDEVASDSSRVVVRLPPRRRNLNVGGTVHGGVITALAETVHGIAVLWQFSPAEHLMVSRELRMEFVAPGRGTLTAQFALDESVRRQIAAALAEKGSCEVQLKSEVRDAGGRTVARLTGTYLIRRRGRGDGGRGCALSGVRNERAAVAGTGSYPTGASAVAIPSASAMPAR